MTFLPVVNPLALTVATAVIVWCGVAALLRIRAAGRPAGALWRWGGIFAAALLLALACWRPVLGADMQARPVGDGAPSVFVVLDRSADMRTQIDAARADIDTLIDRYPDARFALISFAAEPALEWPLSQDSWSLRPALAAIRPYAETPDMAAQVNAGAAATVLRYQLISARQQYPRARNLVYYLGAGAPGSPAAARAFDLPAGSVNGGAVLGYGTAGVDTLQRIAGQIGVPYIARADGAPLESALPADRDDRREAPAVNDARITEMYWAPAAIAAGLLLAELFVVLREFRRTRSVDVDVPR
ncbi:vWA domain-containing protein [Mycobacterium sp. BMJ-28]